MRKMIFAMAIAVAALTSCKKETVEIIDNPGNGIQITASFDSGNLSTRAFFDDTATPEPWENTINNLRIYTFDGDGNWAATYEATAQEIAAGTLNFAIPSRLSTKPVTFYAVANYDLQTKPSRSVMDALLDSYIHHYNGSRVGGDYSSAQKYADGYTMSAKYTTVMPLYGVPENIHFNLKRTIAKIAVRVKLHPRFIERFPDHGLILTSCGISNVVYQGLIMESNPEKTTAMSGSAFYDRGTALSLDNTEDFLFYIGASGKLDADATDKPIITLIGRLIPPGGTERTVFIHAPFNSANDNEVKRNGYYRLELGVTGISGTDFTANLTSEDWGGAETTNKEIGN